MPPTPKRSSERRRRNKESQPDTVTATGKVKVPPTARHWHPIAKRWYLSLKTSGQSEFFEPSDWASAYYVAEMMTKQLEAGKTSAQLFVGVWQAMGDLMSTEAQRRRMRLEIERETGPKPASAGVTALADYRRDLGGS